MAASTGGPIGLAMASGPSDAVSVSAGSAPSVLMVRESKPASTGVLTIALDSSASSKASCWATSAAGLREMVLGSTCAHAPPVGRWSRASLDGERLMYGAVISRLSCLVGDPGPMPSEMLSVFRGVMTKPFGSMQLFWAARRRAWRRAATPGEAWRTTRSDRTEGWGVRVGLADRAERVLVRWGRSFVGAFQPSLAVISSFSDCGGVVPRDDESRADSSAGSGPADSRAMPL